MIHITKEDWERYGQRYVPGTIPPLHDSLDYNALEDAYSAATGEGLKTLSYKLAGGAPAQSYEQVADGWTEQARAYEQMLGEQTISAAEPNLGVTTVRGKFFLLWIAGLKLPRKLKKWAIGTRKSRQRAATRGKRLRTPRAGR